MVWLIDFWLCAAKVSRVLNDTALATFQKSKVRQLDLFVDRAQKRMSSSSSSSSRHSHHNHHHRDDSSSRSASPDINSQVSPLFSDFCFALVESVFSLFVVVLKSHSRSRSRARSHDSRRHHGNRRGKKKKSALPEREEKRMRAFIDFDAQRMLLLLLSP
jgi:hypothetical protein